MLLGVWGLALVEHSLREIGRERGRRRRGKGGFGGEGAWEERAIEGRETNLLNISVTRSISCSAAAIFSADEGWGRPSPNIDIFAVASGFALKGVWCEG